MNGIKHVDLDTIDLDLGRWRTPSPMAVDRMVVSFKQHGQLTPVVVVDGKQGPTLLDGFKRHSAARALAYPSLKAVWIDAEPKRAKAMTYLLNRKSGFSMIQEALLVRELIQIEGLTMSEAALLLSRHKSWVSRRMTMIRQLLPQIVTDLLLELIPTGSATSLARLPQCNQADFAAVIQTRGLSRAQIAYLTDLFCKTQDLGVRRFILEHPRQVLTTAKDLFYKSAEVSRIFRILSRIEKNLPKALMARVKADLIEIQNYLEKKNEPTE